MGTLKPSPWGGRSRMHSGHLHSEAEFKGWAARSFNQSCGTCHAGGVTKETSQTVWPGSRPLALAHPPRDSVDALGGLHEDPTSYDGEYSISDVHPGMRSQRCVRPRCVISARTTCA